MDDEKSPVISDLLQDSILMMAHTVFIKVEDGSWTIIGNADAPEDIVFPIYKLASPRRPTRVLSHNNEIIREATESEAHSLKFKESINPNMIVRALQAKYLNGEWSKHYNDILYQPVI